MTTAYPLTLAWLTDFGLTDPFVGMMKGVALSMLTPQARQWVHLLDVSHGVPAHHREAGAWYLEQAWPTLPVNTVVVAVVDPHVGQASQPYLLAYRRSHQQYLLAPDNGLAAPLLSVYPDDWWVRRLVQPERWVWPGRMPTAGATFAGRDVLTPLAAQLLNAWVGGGLPEMIERTGPLVSAWQPLSLPKAHALPDGGWRLCCWLSDRFGNWVSSLSGQQCYPCPPNTSAWLTAHWPASATGPAATLRLPMLGHYGPCAEALQGLRWVLGSHGYWELAASAQPVTTCWPLPEAYLTQPFEATLTLADG
jgi:S-adenosylmethionine hydrolase